MFYFLFFLFNQEILDFLPNNINDGLTIDEIFIEIMDPSKSTIRAILKELQASNNVSHNDAKPWKWYKTKESE